MTLSYCSLFSFCLSHPVKTVCSVSFWYQNVLISAAPRSKLVRLGINVVCDLLVSNPLLLWLLVEDGLFNNQALREV